jgi:hypothetical protein
MISPFVTLFSTFSTFLNLVRTRINSTNSNSNMSQSHKKCHGSLQQNIKDQLDIVQQKLIPSALTFGSFKGCYYFNGHLRELGWASTSYSVPAGFVTLWALRYACTNCSSSCALMLPSLFCKYDRVIHWLSVWIWLWGGRCARLFEDPIKPWADDDSLHKCFTYSLRKLRSFRGFALKAFSVQLTNGTVGSCYKQTEKLCERVTRIVARTTNWTRKNSYKNTHKKH